MTWTTQTIAGKPVATFAPPGARFTILYLHERDEPPAADNAELTAALRDHRLNCLAPLDAGSWWTNRLYPPFDSTITPERFLLDLVPASPLAAIGGQAAVRLGFRYPQRFPVVASWNAAFDFHDWHGRGTSLDAIYERREQARQDTAVLHVRQNDYPPHVWIGCSPDTEWHRGNDRLHEKLNAVGVPHTYVTEEPRPFAAMVAFAAEALAKQSRRLL